MAVAKALALAAVVCLCLLPTAVVSETIGAITWNIADASDVERLIPALTSMYAALNRVRTPTLFALMVQENNIAEKYFVDLFDSHSYLGKAESCDFLFGHGCSNVYLYHYDFLPAKDFSDFRALAVTGWREKATLAASIMFSGKRFCFLGSHLNTGSSGESGRQGRRDGLREEGLKVAAKTDCDVAVWGGDFNLRTATWRDTGGTHDHFKKEHLAVLKKFYSTLNIPDNGIVHHQEHLAEDEYSFLTPLYTSSELWTANIPNFQKFHFKLPPTFQPVKASKCPRHPALDEEEVPDEEADVGETDYDDEMASTRAEFGDETDSTSRRESEAFLDDLHPLDDGSGKMGMGMGHRDSIGMGMGGGGIRLDDLSVKLKGDQVLDLRMPTKVKKEDKPIKVLRKGEISRSASFYVAEGSSEKRPVCLKTAKGGNCPPERPTHVCFSVGRPLSWTDFFLFRNVRVVMYGGNYGPLPSDHVPIFAMFDTKTLEQELADRNTPFPLLRKNAFVVNRSPTRLPQVHLPHEFGEKLQKVQKVLPSSALDELEADLHAMEQQATRAH